VLNLVDQKDYMGAAAGDPKYWKTCAALFGCGTPFETNAGADVLLKGPNPQKARQLIQEAGYKGEKIVLLSATDQPIVHGQALVTLAALRNAGLNVELQANDWGTLITRRASKEPIEKGGWSIFHTWTSAPDFFSPAVNLPLRANGEKAWFGWPTDPKIEALIDAWFKAPDLAAQKSSPPISRWRPTPTTSPMCRPASSSRRPPIAKTSTASLSPLSSSYGMSRRSKGKACSRTLLDGSSRPFR
jgi:peptide/nickel transport system substrate-binding protein